MITLLAALALSLPPDKDFQPLTEEGGVKVTLAKTEKFPWVRGTGLVAAAPDKLAGVLKQIERYSEIFKGLIDKSKVLKTEASSTRVHLVWPFPIFMKDRDAVVTYEWASPAGKPFTLTWKRSDEPGDPSAGARIDRVEGRTTVEKAAEGSLVQYTYYADLGADFGDSIQEKAWKKEPVKYFDHLKEAVK